MALTGRPRSPQTADSSRVVHARNLLSAEGLTLRCEPGRFVVCKPSGEPLFATPHVDAIVRWLSRN